MQQLTEEQKQKLFNYFLEVHCLYLLDKDMQAISDLLCRQDSGNAHVLRLREVIVQKMNGDKLFVDIQPEGITPSYYNGKIIAYQNVLELMDVHLPVA